MAAEITTEEQLLERFDRISVFSRGAVRAPHKPLLLLLALQNVKANGPRWLRFNEASKRLGELLTEFGTPAKSTRTDDPYRRLANDGVWELPDLAQLKAQMNNAGEITLGALRKLDAQAGFPDAIHQRLTQDPTLVVRVARRIVEKHFPENMRDEVLRAFGFET
jgi:putative restriction endonuclease